MSTKTTFKRIALVTVAALGFGMVATAPSSAVVDANPFTNASTLSTSSLTVVAASGSSSLMGKFYVDVASCKAEARPLHLQEPGPGSDLYQIKGGRLCLYLLLDLDY